MSRENSFPNRHPLVTLASVVIVLLFLLAVVFELVLRFFVDYSIDYYTGTEQEGVTQYPYGEIIINSMGYADDEFDLSDPRPRIGYFGDSVNYGVGAGYPYRISDLVEQALPEYAHWNVGGGVNSYLRSSGIVKHVNEFSLDYAVYLLNLNDIIFVPKLEDWGEYEKMDRPERRVRQIRRQVRQFDALRGNSYLYNFLRFKAKTLLQQYGFEASGYRAYELWPELNREVFADFAGRVNRLQAALAEQGTTFCVVILPYEMQTSADAAQVYAGLGFTWEDGFEQGSAQAVLQEYFDFPYVYDPLPRFDRETGKVGEYFVYNKGDKIDWNHPNRKGHAVISEGFLDSGACPFLVE